MADFVRICNQVLYFAYDTINKIFHSFGLSWLGVVCGLVIISTVLRLFASNLVGTAVNIHHTRQEAVTQQRIERKKAKAATGRGASTTTKKG